MAITLSKIGIIIFSVFGAIGLIALIAMFFLTFFYIEIPTPSSSFYHRPKKEKNHFLLSENKLVILFCSSILILLTLGVTFSIRSNTNIQKTELAEPVCTTAATTQDQQKITIQPTTKPTTTKPTTTKPTTTKPTTTKPTTTKPTTAKPTTTKPTTTKQSEPEIGTFLDPGCPEIPACWPGVDPYRTVYVSRRSHTVHDSPICSGMKHYTAMQACEAYDCGYKRCSVCW